MPAQPFSRFFHHTALAKQGSPRSGPASMFEQSELRSRREERMENGVKNLKGSEAISQNLLNFFLVNAFILR